MKIGVERNPIIGTAALAALCILNYSCAAQLQTNAIIVTGYGSNSAGPPPTRARMETVNCSVDYSAVAARNVSFNGATGNSGAQSVNAGIAATVPVNQAWFVPLGLNSHNLFLGTISGVPIPDQIHTLGLNVGLGCHVNEQWTLAGSVGPRLYRFDSVDASDIGVGGMVRATCKVAPDLTFAFGLEVNQNRSVPVLPAAGLRWRVQTNLTLNLMFPRTSLDYHATRRLKLSVGFDASYTVFRAGNDLGDNIRQSQFNNGLATYRDFRIGVGAEYKIIGRLLANLEGGCSLGREIDYKRIGETVKFGSAPFILAGLKWQM